MRKHYSIKTKLPLNLKPEDFYLFKNKINYKIPELKVKKLKNVFVSHYGLCLKNFLLVNKSAENLIGTSGKNFYCKFYKKVLEQYLVCKYGKSLKSIKLYNEDKYLLIYTSWFGYFSWLTQCIPRLMMVKKNLDKYILIYPESWEHKDFIKQSLSIFPVKQKKVIPDGTHLFIKNLILPEVKPWTFKFNPVTVNNVRDFFYKYTENLTWKNNLGNKIYVSREKAEKRKFANEKQVQNTVKNYGFSVINFEDFSFFEQIVIMKNTQYLISIHGAALTNINFMRPDSYVLELTNKVYKNKDHRFPFWRLSSALNINYYIQFCEPENIKKNSIFDKNLFADINELQTNLNLMLKH